MARPESVAINGGVPGSSVAVVWQNWFAVVVEPWRPRHARGAEVKDYHAIRGDRLDYPIQTTTIAASPGRALIAAMARRARRSAVRMQVMISAGLRPGDPVVVGVAAVVGLSFYFLLFPGVDLAVTALFHRAGEGFPASQDAMLRTLRKSSSLALAGLLVTMAVLLVRRWITGGRGGRTLVRNCSFLMLGLVAGPGLVVNTVLKNGWGRARPIQTDLFGGDAPFSGVWRISDACRDNCSFVSGEASSAAWMVCAVLVLVPARWRMWAVPPAVVYGVALSLNRIAFGGHYLSDVLLSWAITGLVLAGLHRVTAAAPLPARRPLPVLRGRRPGVATS